MDIGQAIRKAFEDPDFPGFGVAGTPPLTIPEGVSATDVEEILSSLRDDFITEVVGDQLMVVRKT